MVAGGPIVVGELFYFFLMLWALVLGEAEIPASFVDWL